MSSHMVLCDTVFFLCTVFLLGSCLVSCPGVWVWSGWGFVLAQPLSEDGVWTGSDADIGMGDQVGRV